MVILLSLLLCNFTFAEDGAYNAIVTTAGGSYTVTVEVESGEVTQVHWPNGIDMAVLGGGISDGKANGTNSKGDLVHIEIDDSTYEPN